MFNAQKIAQFCEADAEGISFSVDVSDKGYTVAGVKVIAVGMYASTDGNDEDGYCDGDMYVSWSAEGLQNDGGGDMGMLLMRGDRDEVGAVMREFYSEDAFTAQLQSILADCGFSAEACADVTTSEWGMQDEERASYDAYAIADEIRKAMQVTA